MKKAQKKLAVTLLIILLLILNLTLVTAVSAQSQGKIQNEFLELVNAERTSLGKTPLLLLLLQADVLMQALIKLGLSLQSQRFWRLA